MLLGRSWNAPGTFLTRFGELPEHPGLASGASLDVFGSSREYFLAAFAHRPVESQLQARISSVFSHFCDRCAHRFLIWHVLLSAMILTSLQSFFLHVTVVVQQAGDSFQTSIFLRMACKGFAKSLIAARSPKTTSGVMEKPWRHRSKKHAKPMKIRSKKRSTARSHQ